jgi:peptide-methionine (S)-S-oxide reductase
MFQREPGVEDTSVGYTGGKADSVNPTYRQVCTGTTGHAEAVQVVYNPSVVPYTRLLELFWSKHNPTTLNRQGADVGSQYRSVIFYSDEEQKKQAIQSKEEEQKKYKEPIGNYRAYHT